MLSRPRKPLAECIANKLQDMSRPVFCVELKARLLYTPEKRPALTLSPPEKKTERYLRSTPKRRSSFDVKAWRNFLGN